VPFPNCNPNARCIKAASVTLLLVRDLEEALGDCELLCLMKPMLSWFHSISPPPFPFRPQGTLPLHCEYVVFLPPVLFWGSYPFVINTVHALKSAPLQNKPISNRANPNTKAWRVLCLSVLQTSSNDIRQQHHVCPPPRAAFVCSNSSYTLMP